MSDLYRSLRVYMLEQRLATATGIHRLAILRRIEKLTGVN